MHEHLARGDGSEQVLFIGRAQEKARIFRTERRRNPVTGAVSPWIVPVTAMVNHFYLTAAPGCLLRTARFLVQRSGGTGAVQQGHEHCDRARVGPGQPLHVSVLVVRDR